MPQPVDALVRIFTNPDGGLRITADDGASVIQANRKEIDVQKDPYAQETFGDARPQIIVGPVTPISSAPFIGYAGAEVHVRVAVKIITRDEYGLGTGYELADGDVTRNKVRDAITQMIEAHKSNPAGDGSIVACWVANPGADKNSPEGPPLYTTTMQIEMWWIQ